MKLLRSLSQLDSFQSIRKTSITVTGSLCTVGGFIADVLQPVAPFAFYIFAISLAILVLLGGLFLLGKKRVVGPLFIAMIAFGVSGLIVLLQQGEETEERGIAANLVPGIASLQNSLGIIDQKLDSIQQDTQELKASTNRIESKSDEVLQSLNEIREGMASADGGIISNPSSPEDHYHNARIHELGGNYAAARRSYLEYFRSDLPQLDPHLRFISFLKVQEGTAGARETYNEITARNPSDVAKYARLLLLNKDQRVERLRNYLQQNPDFAPAAYHLSLEFSEARLGSQTIADQREELASLKAFQQADTNGGLLRHMIDQTLVSNWREDAASRLTAIEGSPAMTIIANPVSISWMAHNAGWNGNVTISEPVLDIKWAKEGDTSTSTGKSGSVDPRTGQSAPRSFFTLPKNQQDTAIEIIYTDLNGIERGPFEFEFRAKKESDDGNRRILEMTNSSWISFRDYEGSLYVYFTHLLSYRGALSKIEYGFDTDQPNQEFAFQSWSGSGIAPIDSETPPLLVAPNSTQYATVRLTYQNGETSPITRFNR